MSAKKMGRPRAEKPKTHEIRTRVDAECFAKVQGYCAENNINQSEFLRKAIAHFLQKK